MKQIITSLLLVFGLCASAQVGVNLRYQNIDSELWKKWTNEENLFSSSYEVGLDYWFRLKNYRVEFLPEAYIYGSNTDSAPEKYSYTGLGLAINTQFYIMDFIGDCNCPTFSKDGNFFTKGFFLSVSPLAEFQMKKAEPGFAGTETSRHLGYGIAVGAGVDIGLTDLITVTPFVRYKFLPNSKWDGLAINVAEPGEESTTTNLSFFQFGIRMGLRPDYVREQNKYRFRR